MIKKCVLFLGFLGPFLLTGQCIGREMISMRDDAPDAAIAIPVAQKFQAGVAFSFPEGVDDVLVDETAATWHGKSWFLEEGGQMAAVLFRGESGDFNIPPNVYADCEEVLFYKDSIDKGAHIHENSVRGLLRLAYPDASLYPENICLCVKGNGAFIDFSTLYWSFKSGDFSTYTGPLTDLLDPQNGWAANFDAAGVLLKKGDE